MKMREVFSLPMAVESSKNDVGIACTELADNDFYLADFRRENTLEEAHAMANAAAHAINQHDKLVELNKELVEALELSLQSMLDSGYSPKSISIRVIEVALAKAKELTK